MELPGNGRSGFRKVFEGKYDKDIRCVCNAAVLINKSVKKPEKWNDFNISRQEIALSNNAVSFLFS